MSAAPVSHRGVWVAPWIDSGRTVVYVIDRHCRLVVGPVVVPPTLEVVMAARLWELLDVADPPSAPHPTADGPNFCRVVKKGHGASRAALALVEQ